MATAAQAPQAIPVTMMAGNSGLPDGALFGLPGVTIYSEQKENNSPTTTTLSGTAQTTAIFNANFKQTDVVYAWRMIVQINQTTITGNVGQALSPYFPYNFLGPIALNMQNQFDTISYFNGFDAILFDALRPQKQQAFVQNFGDQNLNQGYDNYSPGTSQVSAPNAGSHPSAFVYNSNPIFFDIDLLPGIQFDLYYDLEENGMLMSNKAQGLRTFVGPQMMAGTNRIIQPRVTFNAAGSLTAADTSPVTYTTLPTTYTANAVLNFRRKITYQPQSSKDAPLLWNWQYSRQCVRGSIGAVASTTIPLPLVGQILMFYIRMWDPASGTVGAPIPLTNISECDVQIGSGLFRFQDTPEDMQSRLFRQHGLQLPDGILAWDMATLDDGRISNKDAINTLTTSGCQVTITFTGTQSASSYYVLGYEALRYVALQ